MVEFPEQCDDGNLLNGDGCNINCRVEITLGGSLSSTNGSTIRSSASSSQSLFIAYSSTAIRAFFSADTATHTVCRNDSCITINGSGLNECYGTLGCGTELEGHTICENFTCTLVSGAGGNQCGSTADCNFSSSVSSRHSQNLVAAASMCGNGLLEPPEECDDTNRRSGDGCNDSCLLELGICGDGTVQQLLGEQCEQSTHSPSLSYGCRNCRFYSTSCGDGKLDSGEECDKGALNSTSPNADCRPDCSLSRCGDGILDKGEQCDPPTLLRSFGGASDGNRKAGDGCDVRCTKETSLVASDQVEESKYQIPNSNNSATQQLSNQQQIQFPYAQPQPYPYAQLPFASLQPLLQQVPTTTQSGPAAVAIIGAGAAAGFSWMRRRRK